MRPGARAVPFIALLAFAGLVPLVINSHAEGGRDHADSTVSLILHIGAAAVWVGGLLALFLLIPALRGTALQAAVHRYSTLALVAFTSLAASGLLAAWAATGSWEALASPYGAILTAKAVVLIMLGVVGVLHRQWIQKRLAADAGKARRWFVLLAAAELVVMGVASGLAAALARTQPPAGTDTTAAGISALPEPGLGSYLAQWSLDPLWSIACGLAAFLYLAGVQRVRRAGGHWPAARTASWLLGLGILAVVTSGGIHVYQAYLFSAHVLTQMLLTSIVPLFLVPAAPLSLLAQSARERTDGSLGGRELVLGAARPLLSAATAAPYIPAFAIAGSLIALYYTPLLLSGRSQAGYSIMTLVALFCGCLLTAAIVGNSVSSRYASKGFRLAALAATALLYGVYGSALREQAPVLEVPWYNVAGHPWDGLPAAAAETGGVAMWILGAISLGACALAVIAEKPAAAVPEQAPATPAPEVSSTAR
jgi:cytochrome c oxidase assembly factor CtaG/uncharacterized membrane protein